MTTKKTNLLKKGTSVFSIILLYVVFSINVSAQETAIPTYNADSSELTYFQNQRLRKIKIVNFPEFKGSVSHTKWYKNSTPKYDNATLVPDYTLDTLIPSSETIGTTSYFVVIYFNNCACQSTSNIKTIKVVASPQLADLTIKSPSKLKFCENEPIEALSLNTENYAHVTSKIQWYVTNTPNDNSNGVPINEANSQSLVPKLQPNNTRYFYAVMSFDKLQKVLTSNVVGPLLVHQAPQADIITELSNDKTVVLNKRNVINLKGKGGETFKWFQNEELKSATDDKANFYISEDAVIKLQVTDKNNCTNTASLTILYNNTNQEDNSLLAKKNYNPKFRQFKRCFRNKIYV